MMKIEKINLVFGGITATCAVIALSVWLSHSVANEKTAKANQLLSTCKQYYASGLMGSSFGLMCEAFVGKFLDGTISFDKATSIVSNQDEYFKFTKDLPEVKEMRRMINKSFENLN